MKRPLALVLLLSSSIACGADLSDKLPSTPAPPSDKSGDGNTSSTSSSQDTDDDSTSSSSSSGSNGSSPYAPPAQVPVLKAGTYKISGSPYAFDSIVKFTGSSVSTADIIVYANSTTGTIRASAQAISSSEVGKSFTYLTKGLASMGRQAYDCDYKETYITRGLKMTITSSTTISIVGTTNTTKRNTTGAFDNHYNPPKLVECQMGGSNTESNTYTATATWFGN